MTINGNETAPRPDEAPKARSEVFSRRNLIFLAVVAALAGIAYLLLLAEYKRPLVTKEKGQEVLISVPVVPVKKRVLFRQDQLPGEISAYQDVLIYPKVPGFVQEILVDIGSVVRKGQLMVRMYAPEYLARRQEAIADLAEARADLAAEESKLKDLEAELKKRKATLLADQSTYQRVYTASLVPGVIADNDVVQWSQTVEADKQAVDAYIERVNAKYREVAAQKEVVDARLKAFEAFADFASYLEIVAPFDGYVTERKLHVGSFVGPDGTGAYPPICRLKQLDLLRIIAPVPEELAAGVEMGADVDFTVSAFPGKSFVGSVARIANDLDRETRTMPVELNFLNPDYKLFPGMFCKIYWPSRRRSESLFVPITAVVSTPLDTFVCKVENDRIDWVSVKKGEIMEKAVEIFGDIKEGDMVALHGSEELQNQSRVKPVGQPAAKLRKEAVAP